ncbi:MAG: hypothetical protein JKY65_08195 [Planctomycetes bacterium]|nr:hypothetical protein [Planctomycetota bacterium]
MEEQEESDESLFASEGELVLHQPDPPPSEDSAQEDLEDSAQQAFDEGHEGSDEGDLDVDDEQELRERTAKLMTRRDFSDDSQKVAIAGSVAGAVTVGAVMLLLELFDLW